MPVQRIAANPYRPLLVLGSTILIVASLYWAQKFLIPIALAVLLAFILSPPVTILQRQGLGRIFSVLLVVTLAFVLLLGIGAAIALQVRSLARELPERRHQIAAKIRSVTGGAGGSFLGSLQTTIQDITKEALGDDPARPSTDSPKQEKPEPVPVRLEPSGYSQLAEAIAPAVEGLATAGMVVILVIFILIKREDLRNRLVRLIGHGRLIVTTRAIDDSGQRISRYLLMQLLINAGFGLVLGIGLFAIGVRFALLWGFLAGALRFVPYIGTWLAVGLLMAFSIAMFDGWMEPLMVLGLFLAAEVLAFNVLEPWLFGHSTGISSVALLVAAAFWTWLWGPIGLLLSTPLTACLVVLGKHVPQLEFFNVLLGDEPVLDAEVTYYQRLLARDQDEAADLVETHLQNNPLEKVYDEVLIPALVLAKRDREGGELNPDDEDFVLQSTRDVLTELVTAQQQIQLLATQEPQALKSESPSVLIFGCPARDAEDELALHMLPPMLEPVNCKVEVLSAKTLSGELVARVEQERPFLVCIAALPPGGVALTRFLCKASRERFPDLKIAVGLWGQTEKVQRTQERIQAAGADLVATSMAETRNQIVPLIQAAVHAGDTAEAKLQPVSAG